MIEQHIAQTEEEVKKKETEGLIFVAQEQALRTNWIRKNIDGQVDSENSRMFEERDESITHLIPKCKKLAQLYTWNYARSFTELARLSDIVTNLQVYLRITVSKYCGILISKKTMSFNTEDLTYLCSTTLKESVTILILLSLGTKGLS